MRQAFTLLPISGFALIRKVFAGCCQPLLRKGSSQRYLCRPSLRAGTPTPAAPKVLCSRYFPWDIGLPRANTGRRLASLHLCYFGWRAILELQSFHYVPAHRFVRLTGSSYPHTCVSGSRDFYSRAYHGWLPAPCSDYANHPNRAIDGEGTSTPQIRQTCWLLRLLSLVSRTHTCSRSCPELLLQRSPPRILAAAAWSGLGPVPEDRSRGARPHLSRSCKTRFHFMLLPSSLCVCLCSTPDPRNARTSRPSP
jgi:hypothetical protein